VRRAAVDAIGKLGRRRGRAAAPAHARRPEPGGAPPRHPGPGRQRLGRRAPAPARDPARRAGPGGQRAHLVDRTGGGHRGAGSQPARGPGRGPRAARDRARALALEGRARVDRLRGHAVPAPRALRGPRAARARAGQRPRRDAQRALAARSRR
jgi:hypothetical protein